MKVAIYSLLASTASTAIIWLLIKGNLAEFAYLFIIIWPLIWIFHKRVISRHKKKAMKNIKTHTKMTYNKSFKYGRKNAGWTLRKRHATPLNSNVCP